MMLHICRYESAYDYITLPYLKFLANNFVFSSHSDIKLCTYCLYRHTTDLIHEILYLANQLCCSEILNPPTPLIIPHRPPAFLESLMLLKNGCSIHARCSKSSLKHSIRFCRVFISLKQNFTAYHSSKCPHVQIVLLKFTSCDNQGVFQFLL